MFPLYRYAAPVICLCKEYKVGQYIFILLFFAGGLQGIWYILQITDFLPSYHYLLKGTGCFFNPSILALFLVLSFLAGICSFKKEFGIGWKVCWLLNFFTFALWYTVHKFPGILDCFGYGYTVESSPAKIPVSELLVVYTTVGNPVNWNLCRIPDAAGLRARQIFNLAGYRK